MTVVAIDDNKLQTLQSIPSIVLIQVIGFNNESLIQQLCKLEFASPNLITIDVLKNTIIGTTIANISARLVSKDLKYNILAKFANYNNNCFNFGFITYKIISQFNPSFSIDLNSGLLKIVDFLNYQEVKSLIIDVSAEWRLKVNRNVDNKKLSSVIASKRLEINILEENDSIPVIATDLFLIQVFSFFFKCLLTIFFKENNNIGDLVGRLTVIDKKSYSICNSSIDVQILYQTPDGFDFFFRDKDLYTKIKIDREIYPDNIELMIEVRNRKVSSLSHQKKVKIIIGDENDNAPECNEDVAFVISQTKTLLRKQIECFDRDLTGVNSTINLRLNDNNLNLDVLLQVIKFENKDMIIDSLALNDFLNKIENSKQNKIVELSIIAYDGGLETKNK